MSDQLKAIAQKLSLKICVDNKLLEPLAKEHMPVINPATMTEISSIALCRDADINLAVKSAQKAQKTWKNLSAQKRGSLIQTCGQVFKDHADELATLMSYESGKAIRTESRVEVGVIAETFSFYGGLALELKGETIPFNPDMLTFTLREPLGVVGAIIPWNVPLMLMAMKAAPALVAGNTVVLKPSPEASLVVLRAVELLNEILPPGVLNLVTGDGTTGALLVAHPNIDKVAFTGSVESGRKVYKNAAEKIIPVTLELGGKSPMIICEDADLNKAVLSAYEGMRFSRAGQSCSASTRIFVHESIFDKFIKALLDKLNQQHLGDPLDEKTDIGTIISKRQYDKVQSFIKIAEEDKNLTIHWASKMPTDSHLQKGLFIRPALITGLKNDHPICQQEIFGPVAAVLSFSDFAQAIEAANEVEFGLAAGIWTRNLPKALEAVSQLEAGFVQVNQYIVFRPSLPFGGYKHSGIGKEASLDAMLENYTKIKTVLINMKE